jgi:hypothetical protein
MRERFQKKDVVTGGGGMRWLISVIVKTMRIGDNGKEE